MNTYKITTKAFEKMDGLLFQSMLQLVQKQLNAVWQVSESADIVIVDVEQPEGQGYWQTHQSEQQMVVYAKQNNYQAQWYLQKPIRVQPLVQMLNALATWRMNIPQSATRAAATVNRVETPPLRTTTTTSASASAPAPTKAEKPLPADAEFQPSRYLIGLLQTVIQLGTAKRLTYADQSPLYILPQEQRCFTTPLPKTLGQTTLKGSIYTVPIEQIKGEVLTPTALRAEVEKQSLRAYPVETILWYTALQASQGRILYNQPKQANVRLKQWPNFATLPHLPTHMNLAAFMLKKTADLTTIATKTHVPLPIVIDFFNACKLSGLIIEPNHSEPLIEKEIPETKRQLLKGILNRLTKNW
jgi:hypothetical protein